MFKMVSYDSFAYLKHKLWQKKRSGIKLTFDFGPLKLENHLDLFACRWHATYHWKAHEEGYKFVSDLISIAGLHKK